MPTSRVQVSTEPPEVRHENVSLGIDAHIRIPNEFPTSESKYAQNLRKDFRIPDSGPRSMAGIPSQGPASSIQGLANQSLGLQVPAQVRYDWTRDWHPPQSETKRFGTTGAQTGVTSVPVPPWLALASEHDSATGSARARRVRRGRRGV